MNKSNFLSFEGYYVTINFDTPHYLSEFVEYPIKVTYSSHESLPGETYIIQKRYSDLDSLKKCLKSANIPVKFPPKKIIGKFDMNLVNERQVQLEKFLKCVIETSIIGKSVPVTNFLQRSNDYVIDYSKIGFQQVSLDYRCETNWQVQKVVSEMGCRTRKCYISVNSFSNANKYIINWVEFGSEYLAVNAKNVQKFLKSLTQLKHEHIYPITQVMISENGASFIKPMSELGSLHDFMIKTKPGNSIINKYAPNSYENGTRKSTLINHVSMFGRQILVALKYLHDKGVPYGHLHIRNVLLVTEQSCAISDIENTLLGVIPQYRQYYVGILKKMTFPEIDVYSFGRLVYEMVFGEPLMSTYIENDDLIQWPSHSIRECLISILTESIIKNGLPTVDNLLELTLFKSYSNRPIDKSSFKIPAATKEFLESIQTYSLKLLTTDQKQVKSQRRKAEADEIGSKKKQKRKEESRRTKQTSIANSMGDIDITSESLDVTSPTIRSPPPAASYNQTRAPSSAVSSPPPPPPPSTMAPPPPPPPPPSAAPKIASNNNPGRTQLLSSIHGFSKNNLKKAVTKDCSAPKI